MYKSGMFVGALGALYWAALAPSPQPDRAIAASANSAEPAPTDDVAVLRRAALARFKASVPRLKFSGKIEAAVDPELQEQIKVRLFKRALSNEQEQRDPAFRAKAEEAVRMQKPMTAVLRWDDLAGNQEASIVIADSRTCERQFAPGSKFAASELTKLGCLELPSLQNRWDDNATLELATEPVAEGTTTWNRLVQEHMTATATEGFLASARSTSSQSTSR
jgi:hypothetical protein